MKRLEEKLKINFINEHQLGLNFDFIEMELIACYQQDQFTNSHLLFLLLQEYKTLSGGKLYEHL